MTIREPKIVCPVCHEPCTEQSATSLGECTYNLTPLLIIDIPDAIEIESKPCGHRLVRPSHRSR